MSRVEALDAFWSLSFSSPGHHLEIKESTAWKLWECAYVMEEKDCGGELTDVNPRACVMPEGLKVPVEFPPHGIAEQPSLEEKGSSGTQPPL